MQLPFKQEIDNAADTGCGGGLNCAEVLRAYDLIVDRAGICLLTEAPLILTGRFYEDHAFVLLGRRVRAAFSQRRKKLINSLMSRGKWSKEVIMVALEQAEISPGIRAEQLAIGQFAALAEALPR